jgi:hypothetical protein
MRWDGEGTYELGVANKLAGEPEEGLLEVVVGLGRNVVVLEVLLAVMVLALTLRSFTSTLLPVRTMGMFSQTRTRSPDIG